LFCRVRPASHRRILLARTLDEHFFDATHRASCFAKALRSTTTFSRWKRSAATERLDESIGHLGRLGAGPWREDECVGVVVFRRGDDVERCREVVVGLTREPDDDVGRHA
jgi:hypothetical protein